MIRRITLINFMSHKETVIEPVAGLTVLAGENNCGKSAVVSALQILSGNVSGDFMVRHGEKDCVIRVETDEGHVIEWRRKAGKVSYQLNGTEVGRLGGSVPAELHKLLRLPAVEAEPDEFDIHFGEQKKPIFLLNESPARRATFFASSSDTVKLIEMQSVHRRKIQDSKARERDLIKREKGLGKRLDALKPLADFGEQLQTLEADHASLANVAEAIKDLRTLSGAMRSATQTSQRQTADVEVLSRLTAPPILEPIQPVAQLIDGIRATTEDATHCKDKCAAIQPLEKPPATVATAPLQAALAQMKLVAEEIKRYRELRTASERLTAPPAMAPTAVLNESIRAIETEGRRRKQLAERKNAVAILQTPPDVQDTCELRAMTNGIQAAGNSVTATRAICESLTPVANPPQLADVRILDDAISHLAEAQVTATMLEAEAAELRTACKHAEHELLHRAEEFGTCPLCGQSFDRERLLATSAIRGMEQDRGRDKE